MKAMGAESWDPGDPKGRFRAVAYLKGPSEGKQPRVHGMGSLGASGVTDHK